MIEEFAEQMNTKIWLIVVFNNSVGSTSAAISTLVKYSSAGRIS